MSPLQVQGDTLVLGSHGFLGRRVLQASSDAGRAPIGVGRDDVEAAGSLEAAVLSRLSRRTTLVFHVMGVVGSASDAVLERAHAESTGIVIRAVARSAPAARVVVVGSAAELGDVARVAGRLPEREGGAPSSAYGQSKLRQSKLALDLGRRLRVDVLRVRVFNTLGAGQGPALVGGALIERFARAVAAAEHVVDVADPESERDFLDASDVARALVRLAAEVPPEASRPPINVCSGEGTSVAALTGELLAASAADVRVRWHPGHGTPSRSVGECPTLHSVLGVEPVRTISTLASLRAMWSARVTEATTR